MSAIVDSSKAFCEKLGGLFAGPIVLKEIRRTFRTRRFFLAQLIPMLLIGAVIMCVAVLASFDEGTRANPEIIGKYIYGFFFIAQSILLLLVTPAFCCTSITEERERRTFDLLITTGLSPGEIVWGKVLASVGYLVVFLLSSMPLVFVSFLFGGISPSMLILCYVVLLVQGIVVTVFSVYCSSLVKNSKISTVVAYVPVIGGGALLVGFEIAMVVSICNVGLDGLLRDLAGVSLFNKLAMVLGSAYIVVSACSLFLLMAINRVRPATGNHSTSLRIFSTVFLTGAALGFMAIVHWNINNLRGEGLAGMMVFYYIIMPILLLFHTLTFSCEGLPQSSRLRRKMGWLKGIFYPLRIFGTGGLSGAVFNVILCGIVLGVPAAIAYVESQALRLPSGLRGRESFYLIADASWTFFFFVSMLGLLMSSLNVRTIVSRCFIFFLVAALCFGPLFHVIWVHATEAEATIKPTILSGHYFSPITAWTSIWFDAEWSPFDSDQMLRLTADGPVLGKCKVFHAHILLYGALGLGLAIANIFIAPKAKARMEGRWLTKQSPPAMPSVEDEKEETSTTTSSSQAQQKVPEPGER